MAKAILNFHFDYLNPSVTNNLLKRSEEGSRPLFHYLKVEIFLQRWRRWGYLSPLGDKFRKLIFDRVSWPAPLLQDEVFAQIQFIFCSQRGDYKEKWGWQNILH